MELAPELASCSGTVGSGNLHQGQRLCICKSTCVPRFRPPQPSGDMRAVLRHELSLRRADYDMQVIYLECRMLAGSSTCCLDFLLLADQPSRFT